MVLIVLVVFLRHWIGAAVAVLLLLPVIAAAWLYGGWGGIAATLVVILADFLLRRFLWGEAIGDIPLEWFSGLVVTAALVIAIGHSREVARQRREAFSLSHRLTQSQGEYIDFMTRLNTIVRAALESEDMSSMTRMIAQRVGALFSADHCFVTRWDETRRQPVATRADGAGADSDPPLRVMPDERSLTSAVLEAGQTLAIEDLANTPHSSPPLAEELPGVSALAMPLIAGGRRLGAVIVSYDVARSFTPEEIARAELAASQISLVMTQVVLLEEARQRVRELAGLHMISQTFTIHSDNRQIYALLTEILAGLVEAEICMIGLHDAARGVIQSQIPGCGLGDELLQALQFPYELVVRAFGSARRVFRANRLEEIPGEFLGLADSLGIHSLLVAPLWDAKQHMEGAIYAANKPGGFSEDDARLMEIFAGQVAVVIQNTRLLASERRRARELAVLHAIAVAATEADDEDELIERTTHLIGEGLFPDYFATLLLDEHRQDLYLHSSYRQGNREAFMRIPLGIGVVGSVARSGKMCYLPDVSLAADYVSMDPLIQSELCIPLRVGEKVIGVLDAESMELNAFTHEDQELLGILAGQLSTSIQRLRTARAERYQTIQMERSNALVKALVQVGAQAASESDPAGVMQTLGSELSRLGLTCLLGLYSGQGSEIVIHYTSLPRRALRMVERLSRNKIEGYAIPAESLAPFVGQGQKLVFLADPFSTASHILQTFPQRAVVRILELIGITVGVTVCHLPLVSEGQTIGILWLWGEGLREDDLPAMSIFARQVAAAMQNANLLAEVSRLADTDELTGIHNRRYFFDLAEKEFDRIQRTRQPMTIMILDVDHFKQINDRYGHLVGDAVLQSVCQRMSASLRDSDALGRYGGEEFSILLPQTGQAAAIQIAERLQRNVSNTPIETEAGPLTVYLSIGVATIDRGTPSLHALINRADQAMYAAKENASLNVVVG